MKRRPTLKQEITALINSAEGRCRINSISTLIGNIGDIVDFDDLLLNGGKDNIFIDVYHVPVVGEVKVNGNL